MILHKKVNLQVVTENGTDNLPGVTMTQFLKAKAKGDPIVIDDAKGFQHLFYSKRIVYAREGK